MFYPCVKSEKALTLPWCSVSAGVGAGGQLGATGGTLLTQHVLKQQGGLANAEVDARAAFLRHAQKTDDDISRFTAAYKCVQCGWLLEERDVQVCSPDLSMPHHATLCPFPLCRATQPAPIFAEEEEEEEQAEQK